MYNPIHNPTDPFGVFIAVFLIATVAILTITMLASPSFFKRGRPRLKPSLAFAAIIGFAIAICVFLHQSAQTIRLPHQ